jgi:hypothetical protein
MTEQAEVQTTTTDVPQESKPAVDLTVQDLNGLRSVIDVATQRGAFKAGEMEAVGRVYNKLTAFLDAVAASQAPKEGK